MPGYYRPRGSQGVDGLIKALGAGAYIDESGLVHFNNNLIDKVVSNGPSALPYLGLFLADRVSQPKTNRLAILEALRTAEKLAMNGTPGVDQLYPVIAPLNNTQDPLIQIYLAGLYRQLKLPHTFGPLVKMLIQQAFNPQTPATGQEPSEEVGGALLELIANRLRQN